MHLRRRGWRSFVRHWYVHGRYVGLRNHLCASLGFLCKKLGRNVITRCVWCTCSDSRTRCVLGLRCHCNLVCKGGKPKVDEKKARKKNLRRRKQNALLGRREKSSFLIISIEHAYLEKLKHQLSGKPGPWHPTRCSRFPQPTRPQQTRSERRQARTRRRT